MDQNEIPFTVKALIRAALLSQKSGILLSEFPEDFRNLCGESVPHEKYGFSNVIDFLRAIPDIVRFQYSTCDSDWRLFGIGPPTDLDTLFDQHLRFSSK